jgi:hypothetical protein
MPEELGAGGSPCHHEQKSTGIPGHLGHDVAMGRLDPLAGPPRRLSAACKLSVGVGTPKTALFRATWFQIRC